MNGAENLLRTAVSAGVDVVFANPGTTEMPVVAAMDSVGGMRSFLGLFEGVCTGAADGYARISGKPALVLLHLGPGFGNGIANLHNARRARSPVLNVVGNNPTWHLEAGAPLAMDIEGLARPCSDWVETVSSASSAATQTARAIEATLRNPGQVATLILPFDHATEAATEATATVTPPTLPPVDNARVDQAAQALRHGERSLLLLGGAALSEAGQRAAARLQAASGCAVLVETFGARRECGAHLPDFHPVPYFPDQGLAALADFSHAVLAGAEPPVTFFGYAGVPGKLLPVHCEQVHVARPREDAVTALEALADTLGAAANVDVASPQPIATPTGALTADALGQALVSTLPEGAIVVNEGLTAWGGYLASANGAAPHTLLSVTGGAIGFGLPAAVGAAVARPDTRVIAFQADGSAAYTLQALWTMARESLDVTTILCANHAYRILQIEMERAGAEMGKHARHMTELTEPRIDWVHLAAGYGVPGERVTTGEELTAALRRRNAEPGPALIEAVF